MRNVLTPILLLVLIIAACATTTETQPRAPGRIPTLEQVAANHPPETCNLLRWEDGDTPYVRCADGEETAVRMLGIDTAESAFDDNSRKRGKRQADLWNMTLQQVFGCGKAATLRARELCPAGNEVDVVGNERGKYGRRLAYVVCQGINMNLRLVEEGLAGRYPYPGSPEKPSACPLPTH